MGTFIARVALFLVCFVICLYALLAFDYQKIMIKGRTLQVQIFVIVVAMGLAYLMGSFIMAIMYRNVFY